eukprot:evm.model.scf_704.3 EVM.evm.TU.scf_704.3   scf_704:38309-45637(-)
MAASCSGGLTQLLLRTRRPTVLSRAALHKRDTCICGASRKKDSEPVPEGLFQKQINAVRSFTSNGLYQGIAFVGLLGLTDAAYSGDWSRIGVLSKGLEHELQALVLVIAAAHTAMASVAYLILKFRGENPLFSSVKVFLVGVLAFLEVVLSKPADQKG